MERSSEKIPMLFSILKRMTFGLRRNLLTGNGRFGRKKGQMPHPFSVFSTWEKAIKHLRDLFDQSALPEGHWIKEESPKKVRDLVDKETQIQILLYGNALVFACETLGVKDMRTRKYSEVFTVSNEEVYEYISIHGLPLNKSTRKERLVEGFHYYKEEGKWYTLFTERGRTFYEKVFDDEEQGERYIVTTLLQLSGTGLY